MADIDILILIPESTRKRKGGTASPQSDSILDAIPAAPRERLEALRREVVAKSPKDSIESRDLLPAHERFDGNMYRSIPEDAWRRRVPGVEVLIASGLRGVVASRDPIPRYAHSMAEPMAPFGKLNRWWHDRGLPEILATYVRAIRPRTVVDLLSLEYRESVAGFASRLDGTPVKTIDFPGMGRASQPRRGETVAEILRSGKV